MSSQHDERVALCAILQTSKGGWPAVARRVSALGSAATYAAEEGISTPDLFEDTWSAALGDAEAALLSWSDAGLHCVTVLDEDYPARLSDVKQMPPFFFYRGQFDPRDAEGIAVIGSRRASSASLDAAHRIATELADAGTVVVSGLAAGIDTAAHSGALERGGRTVAVIGTGIAKSYPAENRALQEQIASEGLVVSQFWPDSPPTKVSFPLRNELMAGWSWASCVVQADERSGARLQARVAVAQGRRLFFYRTMETEPWARKYVDEGQAMFIGSAFEILEARGTKDVSS